MDKGYTEDVARYKKKSNKKGLPRSKHKHQNIMVCLETFDRHHITRENGSIITKPSKVRKLVP